MTRPSTMSTTQNYYDLADFYDLVYADWDKSMVHQGQAIAQILDAGFRECEQSQVSFFQPVLIGRVAG